MRPDQLSALREPPQPATHRARIHPQPRSDRPEPRTRDLGLDRRPDHRHLVLPPQQRHIRQQHVRARAPPTPRPPRPQQPIPRQATQHPLPAMPPTAPTPRDTTDTQEARRPAQPRPAPARRIRSTSGATSGIQRALPTTPSRREGSRASTNARSLPAPPASSPPRTARAPPLVPKLNGAQQPAGAINNTWSGSHGRKVSSYQTSC